MFAPRKRDSSLKDHAVRFINNMKSIRLLFLLSGLILITFAFIKCSKDFEEERKEALMLSMVSDLNTDSLEADVAWLQNMGTRFSLADNHKSVAVKIRNRLIGMGYNNAKLDSFLVTKVYRNTSYEQWQYNVTAMIEGTEYPDSLCIIGGHYDNNLSSGDLFTIVPGANDNASGIAALLEIARVMKKNSFSPKSTIMFVAFGAEEIGLWGSRHLASGPDEFSGKIRFMLNNDMIAYPGISDPGTSPWCVNIIDYDNSHSLRADAEKMCAKYTKLIYINKNAYSKQSDSYSFYLGGYKALFFFSNVVDPNIHTLNDVAENCNFGYCCEIAKISCALLADKN